MEMDYEVYSRDTEWESADGRKIPVRCLGDVHLANIINHISQHPGWYSNKLLKVMKEEAEIRKLYESFLSRAPIPWQDVDGKWKRWSDGMGRYETIGR